MSNRNSADTAVALDHPSEGLKKEQAAYGKRNGDGDGDGQGNCEGHGNGNGDGDTYGPGPNGLSPAQMEKRKARGDLPDGRHELQDFEAWDSLGFCFPAWKKWSILSVIFIVQCSMNCEWLGEARGQITCRCRVPRVAVCAFDERAGCCVAVDGRGSIIHPGSQCQR